GYSQQPRAPHCPYTTLFRSSARPRARSLDGLVVERKERDMDCCAHEGVGGGDARFDFKKVADGVHVAVAAPAYKVNCNTAIIEKDRKSTRLNSSHQIISYAV